MKKCHENGRSMVEMIGVIAIIGVISAGGLVGYSRAMYKFQLSKVVSMASDALQEYTLFLKRGPESYPTINTPSQIKQYQLMSSCEEDVNDSSACKMPLGKVKFAYDPSDSSDAFKYTYNMDIIFEKAHKNACIDFLVHDWNRMVPDRWWYRGGEIKVTSNHDSGGQILYSSDVNRLNVSGATNACNMVCGENTTECHIIFHFEGERY